MGVKCAVFGAYTRNFEAQNGILAANTDFAAHRALVRWQNQVACGFNANLAVLAILEESLWKILGGIPKMGEQKVFLGA